MPVILTCDASDIGIAAVLSHRDKEGVKKPIAFASKSLSEAQKKYPVIEKEGLAIIFGINKFYEYLFGRHFELETDNEALSKIFGPKKSIPKLAAKRLQHWSIFLAAFDYSVRHISTSKNPADILSRYPSDPIPVVETHPICESGNVSYINYVQNSEVSNKNKL